MPTELPSSPGSPERLPNEPETVEVSSNLYSPSWRISYELDIGDLGSSSKVSIKGCVWMKTQKHFWILGCSKVSNVNGGWFQIVVAFIWSEGNLALKFLPLVSKHWPDFVDCTRCFHMFLSLKWSGSVNMQAPTAVGQPQDNVDMPIYWESLCQLSIFRESTCHLAFNDSMSLLGDKQQYQALTKQILLRKWCLYGFIVVKPVNKHSRTIQGDRKTI